MRLIASVRKVTHAGIGTCQTKSYRFRVTMDEVICIYLGIRLHLEEVVDRL